MWTSTRTGMGLSATGYCAGRCTQSKSRSGSALRKRAIARRWRCSRLSPRPSAERNRSTQSRHGYRSAWLYSTSTNPAVGKEIDKPIAVTDPSCGRRRQDRRQERTSAGVLILGLYFQDAWRPVASGGFFGRSATFGRKFYAQTRLPGNPPGRGEGDRSSCARDRAFSSRDEAMQLMNSESP